MLMRLEVEEMYDDYCWDCEEEGIEPKPFDVWWAEFEASF